MRLTGWSDGSLRCLGLPMGVVAFLSVQQCTQPRGKATDSDTNTSTHMNTHAHPPILSSSCGQRQLLTFDLKRATGSQPCEIIMETCKHGDVCKAAWSHEHLHLPVLLMSEGEGWKNTAHNRQAASVEWYPSTNTHMKLSGANALVTADLHTHFVFPKCVCVKTDRKQTPGGHLIHHCQHGAKQLQNISVNITVCVCEWVSEAFTSIM